MQDLEVFISGEDPVTVAVIKRLLAYVSPRFRVESNIPARGGEVKKKVLECNRLGASYPVIMLLDLDAGCAPQLKTDLLKGNEQHADFLLNISVDEAEAWLMADRQGFSQHFGIDISLIPQPKLQKQGGRKALMEMDFSMKSSWIFAHQLALQSSKKEVREKVGVPNPHGPKKGKEYNDAVVPFVEEKWNIDSAKQNSDSLQRMIVRIEQLLQRHS